MICSIYCITHKESGKQYVGQTRSSPGARWSQHKSDAKCGRGHIISNAVRKYGHEAFSFDVIEQCSIDRLNDLEALWIEKLGTVSPSGYNLKFGGNASLHSEETKAKIRLALTGVPHSEERRANVSAANKLPISDERRQKMSLAKLGKPRSWKMTEKTRALLRSRTISEETKDKISAANRGSKRSPESREKMRVSALARCARQREARLAAIENRDTPCIQAAAAA